MYEHPFIYGRQGPPRTVLYPGYYSNLTSHSVFADSMLYCPYTYYRQFPEVDPTLFKQSAEEMRILMKDASLILAKLADSREFTKKVMAAAQASNDQEVERLLKTTGIQSKVKATFNPDGLNLHLEASVKGSKSSILTIALRWR
ncbi:hypothetical protein E1I69_19815 [Bacillus timonensis]|uniref:Uncharacterized protein n=1 Tax=Bacillus timonensis TaxID=1033734 RepID=A0A4S3PKY2_9BACI|nr:hypothetical protein [Bacillus timonensis]THE10127.1 hypothetical protein E1I69_19815 [Bacillus timonensis]